MALFAGLFEPPQTRRHRKAAEAATALREQAARDLLVELKVLVPFLRAAEANQQKAYSFGNFEFAGRCADVLDAPRKLMERVELFGPQLETEVAQRRRAASSAAGWESYASSELELRDGFIKMLEQVKRHTIEVAGLNSEARRLSPGR